MGIEGAEAGAAKTVNEEKRAEPLDTKCNITYD